MGRGLLVAVVVNLVVLNAVLVACWVRLTRRMDRAGEKLDRLIERVD